MVNPRPGWSCGTASAGRRSAPTTRTLLSRASCSLSSSRSPRPSRIANGTSSQLGVVMITWMPYARPTLTSSVTLASNGLRVLNWSVLSRPNA